MTIEQTIDIPANREVHIRLVVPETIPCGTQNVILDFPQKPEAAEAIKPRAGCMKGTFTRMSDDFNAPLDDFKDYQ
jgi:hypothetical protein